MTYLIAKGSIEEKLRCEANARAKKRKAEGSIEGRVRREAMICADIRHQEDVLRGLSRATGPQRGDFKETKQYDKVLADYRKFKNPNDRKRITQEYEGLQKERRYG